MKFYNCDPSDEEFKRIQDRGQTLSLMLNNLSIDKEKERSELIHKLLGYVGTDVKIYNPFRVDLGKNIEIGDYSLINQNCTFLDTGPIKIGKRVLIGPDVKIYTAVHDIDYKKRYLCIDGKYQIQTSEQEVVIEDIHADMSVFLPGIALTQEDQQEECQPAELLGPCETGIEEVAADNFEGDGTRHDRQTDLGGDGMYGLG